jgi:hypothetical protein
MEVDRLQDESKTSQPDVILHIDESWRRQVNKFQDESKKSRPTEVRSQRKIESRNTSQPKQGEMTKVKFLKLIFFQVKLVQERSNLKVEVEENLNKIRVKVEARWVD